jgi:hypothetical protein
MIGKSVLIAKSEIEVTFVVDNPPLLHITGSNPNLRRKHKQRIIGHESQMFVQPFILHVLGAVSL